MKCFFYYLLTGLFLIACAKTSNDIPEFKEDGQFNVFYSDINNSVMDRTDEYSVSEADVMVFVQTVGKAEGRGNVKTCEPIYHNNKIVYYIINYYDGWQIISADRRGPIILGESPMGGFSLNNTNGGVQTWLGKMVADIEFRKDFPDVYYELVGEDELKKEEYCKRTWDLITANPQCFEEVLGPDYYIHTKPPPLTPPGNYVLTQVYTTTEYQYGVEHLLSTTWHQNSPYNNYCPFKSSPATHHVPAGCTTIAAAQVLYYLHFFLGEPSVSPSSASWNSNNNTYEFGNYVSSTWNLMGNNYNDYASLFIGSIANEIGVTFGDNGSAADVVDFYNVLDYYGLQGIYTTLYNRDDIFESLLSGIPVIFGGNQYDSLFYWPGHTWVIDGFVYKNVITHYYYEWEYVVEPTVPVPNPPLPYEVTTDSPSLAYFKMNWGYGNYENENDAYYSLDGVWTNPLIENDNPYSFNKEILYGFSVL